MDVTSSSNLGVDAGMYAFNKAKEVKNQEVLGALGMTPETQKAQQQIDASMQASVAQATGQGMNVDFKA
jgi:hypothetical protein